MTERDIVTQQKPECAFSSIRSIFSLQGWNLNILFGFVLKPEPFFLPFIFSSFLLATVGVYKGSPLHMIAPLAYGFFSSTRLITQSCARQWRILRTF